MRNIKSNPKYNPSRNKGNSRTNLHKLNEKGRIKLLLQAQQKQYGTN
jgi:hypothetical protein